MSLLVKRASSAWPFFLFFLFSLMSSSTVCHILIQHGFFFLFFGIVIVLFVLCHVLMMIWRPSLRRDLPLNSPGLEGNHQNLPRHHKCSQSQAHGQGEHGFDLVVFHGLDDCSSLWFHISYIEFNQAEGGGGQHTLIIKTRPPPIKQKAARISLGGRVGRYEVGGLRYMRA